VIETPATFGLDNIGNGKNGLVISWTECRATFAVNDQNFLNVVLEILIV
jgi:hypothetical protein